MSYILDALKKAAEQRDRQAPMLHRLLAPSPAPRSAWTHSPGRLLAALLLNAGLLTVLLVIWLRPLPIAPPPDSVGGMGAAASPPEQSLGSAPQQSLGSAPQLAAEVGGAKAVQRERDASVDSAAGPARPKRTGTEPPLGKPNSTPAITPSPPPASSPGQRPPRSMAQQAPELTPTPPLKSDDPTTAPELAGLRLEALAYSDLPEKRMIFVNGHKYVEGDVIEGRLRVEEIQEDGVALSEEGRRITLRMAR